MRTVAVAAEAMSLDPITTKFLGVLAKNRRLTQLGNVIRAFNTADRPPPRRDQRRGHLRPPARRRPGRRDPQNLRTRMGRDIAVELNVDPAILGGLVVKIGSQMIDGSIRTKLNTLARARR